MSILFWLFDEICAIFLHLGVVLGLLWGIYIKKYENFKKTLDKSWAL